MDANGIEETPMIDLKPQREVLLEALRTNNDFTCCDNDNDCFLSRSNKGDNNSSTKNGVTLAWRDLNVYVNLKKQKEQGCKRIINGVSGAVKAGSLVALMGSSGAGKSTLMSVLAYRSTRDVVFDGEIVVNGQPISEFMRHLCGYMHQEDLFVGSLTVVEHLNMMARIKLDRRTTKNERDKRINSIIKHLGLHKCANNRIGHGDENKTLSGGEKKRLAFATELLTDPPLLFCDEPTTGLDSYSAQKMVKIMNTVAASGKTIICTIHQPSSDIFAHFSQLLLLAEGRLAYMGSVANALTFFQSLGHVCPISYNPADFFIKTLAITSGHEDSCKMNIKRICDNFSVSDFAKEIDVIVQYEFYKGGTSELADYVQIKRNFKEIFWWNKLYLLTHRWFLEMFRNPYVHVLKIVERMAIAFVIGLTLAGTITLTQSGIQSVQGAIFLLVAENSFTPMYAILAEFPKDSPLFYREYSSGLYSTGIYYISKIIAMIPYLLIEPVVFILIVYLILDLKMETYSMLFTILTVVLTLNTSSACGIFFSNAFDSPSNAMAYLVPFDYVLMISSGLFVQLNTLPPVFSWAKYLSWLMYSTEIMTVLQWDGIHNITCEYKNRDLPCTTEGDGVIERYNFSKNHLQGDLWCMLFLCVTFHALGFLCLWWRTKRRL